MHVGMLVKVTQVLYTNTASSLLFSIFPLMHLKNMFTYLAIVLPRELMFT